MGRCIYECQNHELCEVGCLEEFKNRQTDCPCEEKCLAGCPCPGYDCIDTTSAPDVTSAPPTGDPTDSPNPTPSPDGNAVLVLGTIYSTNAPYVIDFDGNVNPNSVFEIGEDVTISYGCPATLKGEFWYFGSATRVSKIVGCRLVKQGSMPITANYPSCNTFLQPTPKVLICFGFSAQICHT